MWLHGIHGIKWTKVHPKSKISSIRLHETCILLVVLSIFTDNKEKLLNVSSEMLSFIFHFSARLTCALKLGQKCIFPFNAEEIMVQ